MYYLNTIWLYLLQKKTLIHLLLFLPLLKIQYAMNYLPSVISLPDLGDLPRRFDGAKTVLVKGGRRDISPKSGGDIPEDIPDSFTRRSLRTREMMSCFQYIDFFSSM